MGPGPVPWPFGGAGAPRGRDRSPGPVAALGRRSGVPGAIPPTPAFVPGYCGGAPPPQTPPASKGLQAPSKLGPRARPPPPHPTPKKG